jgi:hypothetical protein
MSEIIAKGLNKLNLLWGILGCALGTGFFLLGFIGDYTLSIGGLVLPPASIYIFGIVIFIAGAWIGAASLKAEKCAACNAALESGDAYFPASYEEAVIEAVRNLDAAPLADIKMLDDNSTAVELSLSYCPKCEKTGKLSLTRNIDYTETELIKEYTLCDERLSALADIVEKHEAHRDKD